MRLNYYWDTKEFFVFSAKMKKEIPRLREFLAGPVLSYAKRVHRERILTETDIRGEAFKELSDVYARARIMEGSGKKILRRWREMYLSLFAKTHPFHVESSSSYKHGAVAEWGTSDPRAALHNRGTRWLPKREFFGLEGNDVKHVGRMFLDRIERSVRGATNRPQ